MVRDNTNDGDMRVLTRGCLVAAKRLLLGAVAACPHPVAKVNQLQGVAQSMGAH